MELIKRDNVHVFVIDKPIVKQPTILQRYKQDGTRYYLCEGNRIFLADRYDEVFAPRKTGMMPKGYKGSNNFKKMKEN